MQFPCVINPEDGSIRPRRSYTTCLHSGDAVIHSLTRYTLRGIPSLRRCMQAAGITIEKPVGKSSHGVVFYVNIAISEAAVVRALEASPCLPSMGFLLARRGRAVMKLMALPKPSRRHDGLVVKPHDSSVMDPYLTCLGSGMVADGASVGFAHLYGTFVAKATMHGVPDTPVVVMVTERLEELLDVHVERCMQGERVQWRRLVGLVLQVMTVLAQGQALCGLVHNDAHLGNFMVSATESSPPASTHAYVETPMGNVLRLPLRERVALIDFGRSSFVATPSRRRVITSELLDKFPKWEMSDAHADVMHFAAMLLLIQPRPDFFETQAAKVDSGGAPPCARALLRLIRAALQCDDNVDMYAQYSRCRATSEAGCANAAIHTLRDSRRGCSGALPTHWLDDVELVSDFLHTDGQKRGYVLRADGPLKTVT